MAAISRRTRSGTLGDIKSQEAAQFLPKGCSRKMPPSFLDLNGVVCSNTLFSNTSALTSSLLFRGNSTCKILEHLVWSNTSGFQFWGPLARTNFLLALCGLPIKRMELSISMNTPHGRWGQGPGSVDPRLPAGLPFPVPEILEFAAFSDSGKFFPAGSGPPATDWQCERTALQPLCPRLVAQDGHTLHTPCA